MTETDKTEGVKEALIEAVESATEGKPINPFEISNLDDLKKVLMIARGQDPDSQQTINHFLDFKNPIERTHLPTTTDVMRVSYLDYLSEMHFPNDPDNPLKWAAIKQSQGLMARKGWKSDKFVEMTKQTPSLTDLSIVGDNAQRSLLDRALGRGKPE